MQACEITAKEGFQVRRVICVGRLKGGPFEAQSKYLGKQASNQAKKNGGWVDCNGVGFVASNDKKNT